MGYNSSKVDVRQRGHRLIDSQRQQLMLYSGRHDTSLLCIPYKQPEELTFALLCPAMPRVVLGKVAGILGREALKR